MRKPLKDVDIVVLLPLSMASSWKTPGGARHIHELFKGPLRQHYGSKVSFDGRTCDTGSKLGFLMANVHFALAREDIAPSFKTELKKLIGAL